MYLPSVSPFLAIVRVGMPVLIIGFVAALPVVGQTPVAHYTFDEGLNDYTVDIAIDSVNGNNGVWQNTNTDGLSYAIGRIGGAVSLRGNDDDYFVIPSISQIDGIEPTPAGTAELGVGITISAWTYVDDDAPSGYKGIFKSREVTDLSSAGEQSGQDWGLAWEGGDHIDARISGSQSDSNADSITRNQWHHVAMVWGNVDSEASFIPPSQIVYVDGVRQDAFIEDTGIWQIISSGSWLIGEDTCCGGREINALLDDLAMFDVAMSDSQVSTLYNNGLLGIDAAGNATGVFEPGDVNEVDGVTIADFQIIRDHIGQQVNARNLGDLNGNKEVDLDDFRMWLDVAPPALAAEALASMSTAVPEPKTLLLVLAATTVVCVGRRGIHS
ncbi:LamG domain-containing protein [Aeoliella sp. ICT_H6.2]|uniref:LamG domain-containing protein n=1 Tax=Aeoliella straminimaris TaxID=2954799 RepID=A0A9X2FFI6_9BACT|nr:LamG domain-containing protein [Aeoliella straminimaris]MCO6044751.1 LamG domain-containing protein [Aeoliella straminimaris]